MPLCPMRMILLPIATTASSLGQYWLNSLSSSFSQINRTRLTLWGRNHLMMRNCVWSCSLSSQASYHHWMVYDFVFSWVVGSSVCVCLLLYSIRSPIDLSSFAAAASFAVSSSSSLHFCFAQWKCSFSFCSLSHYKTLKTEVLIEWKWRWWYF